MNKLVEESPTAQQLAIRKSVLALENLRVTAHAGTGKTTTLIWAVGHFSGILPQRRVLFMEYNRDLRLDAKEKVKAAGLHFVSVHNYDSFLLEFYDEAAPSHDFQLALNSVLEEDRAPIKEFEFETLVVDEVQDMTEPFRDFILKLLRDNKSSTIEGGVQLILAGDPKQTIYGFRGAKSEYLLSPQEDWPGSSDAYPTLLPLDMTFRFGPVLCNFVNDLCRNVFSREAWISDITAANPDAEGSVELWEISKDDKNPHALVERYLNALRASGTTAIISASIREENVPLGRFIEACSERDCVPQEGENDAIDVNEATATLRTIHTSKGKQYDTVFLFITQISQWLTPTGRLKKEKETVLYVAATRAKKSLVIVQDTDDKTAEGVWRAASRNVEWKWGRSLPASSSSAVQQTSLIQLCWIRPSVVQKIDRDFDSAKKERLLRRVNVNLHRFAPKMISEPTLLEELIVFTRVLGAPTAIEDWVKGARKEDPQIVYNRLFTGPQASHVYLPKFGDALRALTSDLSDWNDWFVIASLHSTRRYGHARIRGEEPPRPGVCEILYSRGVERLKEYDRVRQIVQSDRSLASCSSSHVFFRSQNVVVLPVYAATDGTRPVDIFASAVAAHCLKCSEARIDYLHRGIAVYVTGDFGAIANACCN